MLFRRQIEGLSERIRHAEAWRWKRALPALFLVGVMLALAGAAPTRRTPGKMYRYRSLMAGYWRFIATDRTTADAPTRIRRFRTEVVTPNRDVFDAVAGGWMGDGGLLEFINRLEGKTAPLRQVDAQFPARLSEAWRSFNQAVPDLKPGAMVVLVPAPEGAVGGAVRPIGDRDVVVFGAEEITKVIGSQRALNVLVQHEMTHLYHMQVNPEMRRMIAEVYMPPYATGRAKLYQVLWLEGLAAYMSKHLNPDATDKEVLNSDRVASEVKALWPKIGSDLRAHLDSSNKSDIDAYLFDSDTSGRIPKRAGYYIGMLIAQRLARSRSFAELCRLEGAPLRSAVEQGLRELERDGI